MGGGKWPLESQLQPLPSPSLSPHHPLASPSSFVIQSGIWHFSLLAGPFRNRVLSVSLKALHSTSQLQGLLKGCPCPSWPLQHPSKLSRAPCGGSDGRAKWFRESPCSWQGIVSVALELWQSMTREESPWDFRLAVGGLGRPSTLAVCRELIPAALHVAEGAGHAVLVPDNERPAEKQQARSCQRQAGATVPGIGGADGTLAAREASAIRLPSAIPKEVWKGTERGTIRVPGTSPSASRLICPAAPGPLPPTPLDGGEARALEDKSLRSAGPPLTALQTGSRPRPS